MKEDRVILKVKSGAVVDAYATRQVQMTVVDVDMIEPGDSDDGKIKKTVFSVPLDGIIAREEVDQFIKDLAINEPEPEQQR